MVVLDKLPNVSHFADIDVQNFVKQSWRYAFHLYIPKSRAFSVAAKLNDIYENPDTNLQVASNRTVLIPYLMDQNVDLPPAVRVVATQSGGKHVEDLGRTKQTQSISGTSGFLSAVPTGAEKWPKVENLLNFATRGPFPNAALTEKGKRSGYAWFHRFLNLFEVYWNIKRTAPTADAEHVKMVWVNEKDDETWVIVPTMFNWRRSAPKNNFTYDWNMTFEVIEKFDRTIKSIYKSVSDKKKKNLFDWASDILAVAQAVIDYGNTLISLSVGLVKDYIRSILSLIEDLSVVITSTVSSFSRFAGDAADIAQRALDILDNFSEDIVRIFDPDADNSVIRAYNEFYIMSAGMLYSIKRRWELGTSNKSYDDIYLSMEAKYEGLKGKNDGSPPSLTKLLSSIETAKEVGTGANPFSFEVSDLGTSPVSSGASLIDTRYDTEGKGFLLHEGENGENSRTRFTGTTSAKIYKGDNIFSFTARNMGSIEYWVDIVLLNNLSSPYISDDENTNSGVRKAGDNLLIPATSTNEGSSSLQRISEPTTPPPQLLGVTTSGSTESKLEDIARNQDGYRWIKNQWKGFSCSILAGSNLGVKRTVLSNDEYNLYFKENTTIDDSITSGDTSLIVAPGSSNMLPTVHPYTLTLEKDTVNEETVVVTARSGNVLTLKNPIILNHSAGSAVAYGESFPQSLDDGDSYLISLDQVKSKKVIEQNSLSLGFDLRLDLNSKGKLDLVLGDQGDVDTVVGIDAFKQSMVIGLDSTLGSLPLLPDIGMPDVIGQKATSDTLFLVKFYTKRLVLSDPRVADIKQLIVSIGSKSDILEVTIVALLITGESTNIVYK